MLSLPACACAAREPERAAYQVGILDLLLSQHRTEDAHAEAEAYVRSVDEPLLLAASLNKLHFTPDRS